MNLKTFADTLSDECSEDEIFILAVLAKVDGNYVDYQAIFPHYKETAKEMYLQLTNHFLENFPNFAEFEEVEKELEQKNGLD